MKKSLVSQLELKRAAGKKALAVLIDPDKVELSDVVSLVEEANHAVVDFFFINRRLLHL